MKSTIHAVVLSLLTLACTPKNSNETGEAEPRDLSDTTRALYAVSVDTAINCMKHYDEVMRKHFEGTDPIKSFTIRATDFIEAMGMKGGTPTYDYVRVYLGFDYKNQFRLFLTPVEGANLSAVPPKAGKDVILSGPFTMLGGEGAYMLDFATPCPTTCQE